MKNNRKILKREIKKEKGAIATFVVVTVFFFVIILMGAYISTMNLKKSQLQSDIRIQELYGGNVNKIDQIYNEIEERYGNVEVDMEGYQQEFVYTGSVQEWQVPATGIYKIEVYGAQGGSVTLGNGSKTGGTGGYAYGEISLVGSEILYIVVGGAGVSNGAGGYNGGGATNSTGNNYRNGSGGGATHIATTNRGELKEYSSYQNEVLIVAGGGGGAAGNYAEGATSVYAGNGGTGGGTSGGNASANSQYAYGGSQTSAGYKGGFGYGGSIPSGNGYGAGGRPDGMEEV